MAELFSGTVAVKSTSSPITTVPGTIVTIESTAKIKIEGETGADLATCEADKAVAIVATSTEITITAFDVAATVLVSGEQA